MINNIEQVLPPLALAGGDAFAMSNGRWVPCKVERVTWVRKSRARIWQWVYHIRIDGIAVVRYSGENTFRRKPTS